MEVQVGDWVKYDMVGLVRIEEVTKVESQCVFLDSRGYWIAKEDILEVRKPAAVTAQGKEE
jgi:hypothetical protein